MPSTAYTLMNTHNIYFYGEIRFDCAGVKQHVNPCGSFCVVSQRKGEKRRESRGDERKGQGRKRNRNVSEETERIKTSSFTLICYKDSRPCPTVSQYQLDAPVTPSPHTTTPWRNKTRNVSV